jgi:hypothetical protein
MKHAQQSLMALVIAGACGAATAPATAWESTINGQGQGHVDGHVWCFPNRPPNQPTFVQHTDQPSINMGPGLSTCNQLTLIHQLGSIRWRQQSQFRAAAGDTVDWHSMLPFVTPSSPVAVGFLDVSAVVLNPSTANFTVTWSGSDPGVAMHLGWFDPATTPPTLLHQEMRIGPWSETIVITIVSSPGNILNVDFESSGAAVSLAPGQGGGCGSADFNCDGDLGTDADIEAFFACLAGACPLPPCSGSADFNGDGDLGTDADIEAFFRVLGGGTC